MTAYEQWLYAEAREMKTMEGGIHLIALLLRHHAITDRNPQAINLILKFPIKLKDNKIMWDRIKDVAKELYARGEKMNGPKKKRANKNRKNG